MHLLSAVALGPALLCLSLPQSFDAHEFKKKKKTKFLVFGGLGFQGTLTLPTSAQLQDPEGHSGHVFLPPSLLHTPGPWLPWPGGDHCPRNSPFHLPRAWMAFE